MFVTFKSVNEAIPPDKSTTEIEPSGSTEYVEFGSPSFAVKIFV